MGMGVVPPGERASETHRQTPLRQAPWLEPGFAPPTPTPPHKGEGFPRLFWFRRGTRSGEGKAVAVPPRKLVPAGSSHGYPRPTSSPRGSHPEVCRWRGGVGACGWPYKPGSGGFGAPPWGYYGPCARSSLEGRNAGGFRERSCGEAEIGPARDTPLSDRRTRPKLRPSGRNRMQPIPISAARRLKNADRRNATGRAEGGSILPRRILAQWKRPDTICASRRSAAPHSERTRRRGRAKAPVRRAGTQPAFAAYCASVTCSSQSTGEPFSFS
jgi:hypothetical protein